MNQTTYKTPTIFSVRRVSIDQAMNLLRKNGIIVNKDEAEVILDFLYLIAKTYKVRQHLEATRENKSLD